VKVFSSALVLEVVVLWVRSLLGFVSSRLSDGGAKHCDAKHCDVDEDGTCCGAEPIPSVLATVMIESSVSGLFGSPL
jgi:hypothetical protein